MVVPTGIEPKPIGGGSDVAEFEVIDISKLKKLGE